MYNFSGFIGTSRVYWISVNTFWGPGAAKVNSSEISLWLCPKTTNFPPQLNKPDLTEILVPRHFHGTSPFQIHQLIHYSKKKKKNLNATVTMHAYMLSHFSRVQLFATPWTVDQQALLFMGLSRQQYRSWLPCPPPGDFPDPGIEPGSHVSYIGRQILDH